MAVPGEARRIALWAFWVANLLINVLFVIMAWATADNLSRASGNLHIENGWTKDNVATSARAFISNSIFRAPIAACALGGLMVVLFNLMSCFVLVRRSWVREQPGFGYGAIVAWSFVMSFLLLMVGLVLEGFKDVVKTQLEPNDSWSTVATGAFTGAYTLAYIVAVMFMLFFLVLLLLQRQVTTQLGIYDAMQAHKRAGEFGQVATGGGVDMAGLQSGPI